MRSCLFCDIVKGAVPAHKIGEDAQHLAFLTPYPNTLGASVVITKEHHLSYLLEADKATYTNLLLFARQMGRTIDSAMAVQRTALVAEGYGIDHLHVKLFPMHGVKGGEWKPINSNMRVFYEKYMGFISSHDGPKRSDQELAQLARQIRKEMEEKRALA